jgi:hypothetical protein
MGREVTVVNIADIPMLQQSHGRTRDLKVKPLPLDTGVPGVRMEPAWLIAPVGYGTPRHRHVFDQVKFVMDGEWPTTKDITIHPGECSYFPEGVYYGPQMQKIDCTALVLQFQGPSGIPYLTHDELRAAQRKLESEGGVFKDGVYTMRTADGRTINKDSHKACWEEFTGQDEVFPEGRVSEPVLMRSQMCRWIPDRKLAGVEHKHLGTFAEMRTGMALLRVLAGSRLPAQHQEDAEIRYLIDGAVTYDGKRYVGGTTEDKGAYFYLPHETDVKEIVATEDATFFVISLPFVREMEDAQRRARTATAA